jgi:quercetin dioxygenase-like cupin family protein
MKLIRPRHDAATAVAAHPDRPATAVLHDSPDARVIVFRIGPGQEVPPHRNASSVHLAVLEGNGVLSGETEARDVTPGVLAIYEPNELHGMRATADSTLVVLALITPRPGTR